jgi:putative spermidine/putrescine transport system substrate-binding protein
MKTIFNQTLLVSVVAVTTAAQAEVNIASWGGSYTASQQKAYQETYRDPDSINFIKYNGGLDEVRTQIESGNVTWDIVDVFPAEARVGCDEGLFEELDRSAFKEAPDGTLMDDDIMVEVPNDCVVPQIFWSYVPFYQEGTFQGARPTTIADFFDVEKFPGKRGIHTWPNALIEMALLADGVSIRDIYKVMSTDEGIDRAFKMLDRIKEYAVFWSSGATPLELVKSGEVAMSTAYNGRVGSAVLSEGARFVVVWDGQVLEEEWLVMMKGAPNKQAAMDFLIHASSTASQAEQAKYINYGPMRASAFEIMKKGEPWFHNGKNIMEHMPNRPEVMARTVVASPDWWAYFGDSISARYSAWMSQ